MAILHDATITPEKSELIAAWVPTQPWGPPADVPIELIGAFRFDDPDGRVGMETHLVTAGDNVLQIPLTYRDEPLHGAEGALIAEMEHSALGTRWVYDGLRDPRLIVMLAAVTMTGQGEAIGMVVVDGRWYVAPSKVRVAGGGWTRGPVPVDGFDAVEHDTDALSVTLRNDRFDLIVHRRPVSGPRPVIGLTATWDGQRGSGRARRGDGTLDLTGLAGDAPRRLRGVLSSGDGNPEPSIRSATGTREVAEPGPAPDRRRRDRPRDHRGRDLGADERRR